jgi:hypothetical protein
MNRGFFLFFFLLRAINTENEHSEGKREIEYKNKNLRANFASIVVGVEGALFFRRRFFGT